MVDKEKTDRRRTWKKEKEMVPTMKGAVEGKEAAIEKGVLEFDRHFLHKREYRTL